MEYPSHQWVEVRKICTAGKRSGTKKSFSDAAGIEYEPKATIPATTVQSLFFDLSDRRRISTGNRRLSGGEQGDHKPDRLLHRKPSFCKIPEELKKIEAL